jgi:2-phosphosulfolactate phosphatase
MFSALGSFTIRCEWGPAGLAAFLEGGAAGKTVVIVDVLSFTTSVEIATSRGARVYPYPWLSAAEAFAAEHGALLASSQRAGGYSLSPASLLDIPAGTSLVLPSPNGGALSRAAMGARVFAGCLRNASAVARAAGQGGGPVCVLAAGERWPDGSLRPAIEDWLGAGAIVHALPGSRSPEAAAAEAAFLHLRAELPAAVHACASGQELISRGFPQDVALASMLDTSETAPYLEGEAYIIGDQ